MSALELRRPEVRDLAWVIAAPGLLEGASAPAVLSDAECAGLLEKYRARLVSLDREPAELDEWLAMHDRSRLLGRYFEALVGFWIQRLFGARRFEPSLKVLSDRQVVGELDFVFEEAQGEEAQAEEARGALQHWETSVKFYLCASSTPEGGVRADAFLGTMTRDRLDKKIGRLFERQLKAPRSVEGRTALLAAGFDPDRLGDSRLLMKGALFYPADRDWRTHPHPPEVSPRHQRGWWSKRLPEGEAWVLLDRRRWLSPFESRDPGFAPLTRDQMQARIDAHFAEHRTALMVAGVTQGVEGAWSEAHRGLIVHTGWPWRVL